MQKHTEKLKNHAKKLEKKQIAIVTILLIIVVGALLLQLLQPKRSVAAYCRVLKEENARLATKSGDTYATSVFTEQSSNPHDFVVSLGRLEEVAPDDIRPDVKTLRQTFEKIEKDPSQLIAAGIGGLSAEGNIEKWNRDRCKN